ncbi:hypothetical protein L9F63_013466, partial [Diploptera punctata]
DDRTTNIFLPKLLKTIMNQSPVLHFSGRLPINPCFITSNNLFHEHFTKEIAACTKHVFTSELLPAYCKFVI